MTAWDEEVDVLAAGSGAGLAGAYTSAQEGLSTLVVEASNMFGGTTVYLGGGGRWFACNPTLQRAGTDDTLDAAMAYVHAAVGDGTPLPLQHAYVTEGPELSSIWNKTTTSLSASCLGRTTSVGCHTPRPTDSAISCPRVNGKWLISAVDPI